MNPLESPRGGKLFWGGNFWLEETAKGPKGDRRPHSLSQNGNGFVSVLSTGAFSSSGHLLRRCHGRFLFLWLPLLFSCSWSPPRCPHFGSRAQQPTGPTGTGTRILNPPNFKVGGNFRRGKTFAFFAFFGQYRESLCGVYAFGNSKSSNRVSFFTQNHKYFG